MAQFESQVHSGQIDAVNRMASLGTLRSQLQAACVLSFTLFDCFCLNLGTNCCVRVTNKGSKEDIS
jgi:hypothetical protein